MYYKILNDKKNEKSARITVMGQDLIVAKKLSDGMFVPWVEPIRGISSIPSIIT